MKVLYSLFIICFLFINTLKAQKDEINTERYILCINSYTDASPWSSRMISSMTEFAQGDPGITLYAEHMNMLLINDDAILQEFKHNILGKYQKRPRMVVLLGNPALLLRDELRNRWGDIPIILCAQEDYVGPQETYLRKQPIKKDSRIPLADLAEPYNLTFLYANLYLHENIRLMKQMLPDMKELIFIGDGRQVNQNNAAIIEEELNTHYPDIKFQFFSSEKMTTNQLLDSLYHENFRTTGVLFSSWFCKSTFAGNTSLTTNSHKLIATVSIPLFSLNFVDIESGKEGW